MIHHVFHLCRPPHNDHSMCLQT